MKARNIIPGWPRGRSTTTAWSNHLGVKRWKLFWPIMSFAYHNLLLHEVRLETEYQEGQQDMVNAWFERYRLDPVEATTRIDRVPRWMAVAMVEGEKKGLICVEAKA